MFTIHLKTALGNIRRSPFQALAAVFVFTITFFVATMIVIVTYSSNNILKYFATRPQIIAFLKDNISATDAAGLQNKLLADSRIKSVHYVSKEEALKIYKDATSDNPLLSELVSPSTFPASLEFSVNDISFAEEVISEVKGEAIVDSVGFTASLGGEKTLGDVVSRLKSVTSYIQIGGIVFIGILGVISFLVLMVIMGMRMTTKRGEIEILKLIGATPGFIRSPVMLEAAFYAVVGVLVGWLLAFVTWLYLTPSLLSYFGEIPVLPKAPLSFFAIFAEILGAEMLVGLSLAFLGSYLTLSRARRMR
jgi:cell division transport system permease protein